MKANELMIDDWVLDKKTNRPYKIIGTNDLLFHNDYSPIPLTAEILERNGFKREDSDDDIHRWFILIYEGVRFSLLYARSVFQWLGPLDFKYVHELQHALRLCGIEKEIEI